VDKVDHFALGIEGDQRCVLVRDASQAWKAALVVTAAAQTVYRQGGNCEKVGSFGLLKAYVHADRAFERIGGESSE